MKFSLKRAIGKLSRVLLVYFQTSPVPHHEKKMLMLPAPQRSLPKYKAQKFKPRGKRVEISMLRILS